MTMRISSCFETGGIINFTTLWKGTAAGLYKDSKKIKQWDVRELEQFLSATRHSYLAYQTRYDELTRASPISQAAS